VHAFAATLALLLERIVGYPPPLFRVIRHPVVWMGALISLLDRKLNRSELAGPARKWRGVLALVLLLLAMLIPTGIIALLLRTLPYGWVIEGVLGGCLLAQKELGRAVRSVAEALDFSLEHGRKAVSGVVGRDPDVLDEAGVARAAIESLAESTSDGVIAPLFWMLVLGLPGIALYKAVNTADSMIGHKSPRYLDFGWASARFDDLINWIPARLTGLLLVMAAAFVSGAKVSAAWETMLSDASKHDSPNAGWPEAAMAGALGFKLGGPRAYGGEVHALPSFGSGRAELTAADIRKALELYGMALNIALGICVAIAVLVLR
jgi:adenosylcobinamide-phosphate synthase